MIDLHLHTTASDGRSSAADLVAEAVAAGCETIAVTDHDTVAGLADAAAAAGAARLTFVTGRAFDGLKPRVLAGIRDLFS